MHFTIKDIENLIGIKAHTIRIWEKRFSFSNPQRTKTNIRLYSSEDLKYFFNVSLLNKQGFKISHISRITAQHAEQLIESLNNEEARQQHTIHQLILKMIDFDIDGFENILNTYIKANDIDACISNIVSPFLKKADALLHKKNMLNASRHLLLNSIRQKIISGIEAKCFLNNCGKTILSFLPEDDYYEIELLYAQFLMKQHGLNVIYLGANVPVKDVIGIAKYKKPDFIYTHISNASKHFYKSNYFEKLSQWFKEFNIIVTSALLPHKNIPANIQLKNSIPEAVKYIA